MRCNKEDHSLFNTCRKNVGFNIKFVSASLNLTKSSAGCNAVRVLVYLCVCVCVRVRVCNYIAGKLLAKLPRT